MGTPLDYGHKNYNHYGAYLKNKYDGQRVYKIIADAGFTCPNRDGSKGYGGCTYCNVDSFTPELSRKLPTIKEQIEQGMERAFKNYRAEKFIIYFQPNTNTYAPTHYLKMLYDEALSINTKNIKITLPDNGVAFTFLAQGENNVVQLKSTFNITRTKYEIDEYDQIKELFSNISKVFGQQIVLEKE